MSTICRRNRTLAAVATATLLLSCGVRTSLDVAELGVDNLACVSERDGLVDLEVSLRLGRASVDVVFLLDHTRSMSEPLESVRRTISGEIVPSLVDEVPDLQMAVASYGDFYISGYPYGAEGDSLLRLLQASTPQSVDVVRAAGQLRLEHGGDTPEALAEALYLLASGEAFPGYVEAEPCESRGVGLGCFRESATTVFLVFTDAPSHNGPRGADPYDAQAFELAPHSFGEAAEAVSAIGAGVVGVYTGRSTDEGFEQLQDWARGTHTVDEFGDPLVFHWAGDTAGLSSTVVGAVLEWVERAVFPLVSLQLESELGPMGDDWSVEAIQALVAAPAGAARSQGELFIDVAPGATVTFRVRLRVSSELLLNGLPLRARAMAPPAAPLGEVTLLVAGPGADACR